MTPRTSGLAVKQFVGEIKSAEVFIKFEQVLELISGPIAIAKDKIKIIDTVGDIAEFISDIPAEYKSDIRAVIVYCYEEEVSRAIVILDEIDLAVEKLETISETFNQRTFEVFRSGNQLDDRELIACYEDLRRILVYFRLKLNIIRNYLNIPFKSQPVTVSLSALAPYEETALELFLRLQTISALHQI